MKCLPECLAAVAAFLLATAAATSARADDYPTRPVTLIVPYTPGGNTEISGAYRRPEIRATARQAGRRGEQAGRRHGDRLDCGRAVDADGYTLLMATPTPMAINVTVHKSLP